jgi:hypothetical protein
MLCTHVDRSTFSLWISSYIFIIIFKHIYQLCSAKFDVITRVHFPIGDHRRTVNFAICDEVVRQPRFVEESGSVVHDATCHYPLCDVSIHRILT